MRWCFSFWILHCKNWCIKSHFHAYCVVARMISFQVIKQSHVFHFDVHQPKTMFAPLSICSSSFLLNPNHLNITFLSTTSTVWKITLVRFQSHLDLEALFGYTHSRLCFHTVSFLNPLVGHCIFSPFRLLSLESSYSWLCT